MTVDDRDRAGGGGRRADRLQPRPRPRGRRGTTRAHGVDGGGGDRRRSTPACPTSCCSTSACPTATARRSAVHARPRPPARAGDRADRPRRGGRRRARPRDGRRRLRRQAVPPRRAAGPDRRPPPLRRAARAEHAGAGDGREAVVGDLTHRPRRPPGRTSASASSPCGRRSSTCSSGSPATPASVVTREQLIDDVWDENWWGSTKTLDVHINSLRRKLGEQPGGRAGSPRSAASATASTTQREPSGE